MAPVAPRRCRCPRRSPSSWPPRAGAPGWAAGEAAAYYPPGGRTFARVIAADDVRGGADATLARDLGARDLFVLNDRAAYGIGVATDVSRAAKKLGLHVVRFTAYDPA